MQCLAPSEMLGYSLKATVSVSLIGQIFSSVSCSKTTHLKFKKSDSPANCSQWRLVRSVLHPVRTVTEMKPAQLAVTRVTPRYFNAAQFRHQSSDVATEKHFLQNFTL